VNGHLDKDIRFKVENGCLKIEKWNAGMCFSRFIHNTHHRKYSVQDNQIDRSNRYKNDPYPYNNWEDYGIHAMFI